MLIKILCVDYQNEFCAPAGLGFKERPCHEFIKATFIPFLRKNEFKIAGEILCDFRLPRPNEIHSWCIPGEWGYLSAIDADVKSSNVWVKSMHSPEWVRKNGGESNKKAGPPYQDTAAFSKWLINTIGSPDEENAIVLFGLTLECCVLNTAIALSNRGYKVSILNEASDIYDMAVCKQFIKTGINYKDFLFATSHREYASKMSWEEFKEKLESSLP